MHAQRIDLDYDTGVRVARVIYEAFIARRGVFQDTNDLLENQIPEGVTNLSREHGNFLFFLISQDHGVKSWRLYERAKQLYGENPGFFDPGWVHDHYAKEATAELASSVARPLGTRYPNETGRQWYLNAQMLVTQYGGDARRIFQMATDSLDAMKRIREFRGFGPKTGALLFRTLYGCGFFHLPRKNEVPIPVDIHDTRIAHALGLLKIDPSPDRITSENYARYARFAQQAWIAVCERAELDWLVLDRALWLLGSRGCSPDRYLRCCTTHNCAVERR